MIKTRDERIDGKKWSAGNGFSGVKPYAKRSERPAANAPESGEDLECEAYEWQSGWCGAYDEEVIQKAKAARAGVGDEEAYLERQKGKYLEARRRLRELDGIRHYGKPAWGRCMPTPEDEEHYFSGYFTVDFSGRLLSFKDSMQATDLFRELIGLCDDFNVFWVGDGDDRFDQMRCVFVVYNISKDEPLFWFLEERWYGGEELAEEEGLTQEDPADVTEKADSIRTQKSE